MKITSNGISSLPLKPPEELSLSAPDPRESESPPPLAATDSFNPSPEWLRILNLVKQQPEVREDRVQQAQQRLQRGEYLSPQSAEETVEAYLRALD